MNSHSKFEVLSACVAGAACQRGTFGPLDGVMCHATAKEPEFSLPLHEVTKLTVAEQKCEHRCRSRPKLFVVLYTQDDYFGTVFPVG